MSFLSDFLCFCLCSSGGVHSISEVHITVVTIVNIGLMLINPAHIDIFKASCCKC